MTSWKPPLSTPWLLGWNRTKNPRRSVGNGRARVEELPRWVEKIRWHFSSFVRRENLLKRACKNHNWLVVFSHPSEKYEFVNWDDEIPNIWEKKMATKPPTRQILHRALPTLTILNMLKLPLHSIIRALESTGTVSSHSSGELVILKLDLRV